MNVEGDDVGDVVDALERLGLSNYEARVFIALQRLGVGTAKEVHDVAGVPRSQVYGAAESLEARGLVELQRSTPKRYRPVNVETARERLTASIERDTDRAFDYLEDVEQDCSHAEARDDVWTVRGRGPISGRCVELARGATDRLIFAAARPELVGPDMVEAVEGVAAAGVDVLVVSANDAVRRVFDGTGARVESPVRRPPEPFTGRLLVVDDRTALLSVEVETTDAEGETAIWSTETPIAAVLVQFLETGMKSVIGT